ncbi:PASTA domain-containing protein [Segetibacter aerophilus]|uniref:PASTA domain-containing protein n=1 Tax=Segetibacter aerophilus TaxID=670293 RepID=UPI001FE3E046|nr:PASTA domain-containing protein [Segetibacter aerophilus]
MFKFITRRPLWISILVVLILTTLLILLFFGSLDFLTKHGDYQKVPSVVGKSVDAARKLLEDKGFEVEIQDSLYIDTFPKLAVIKQTPGGDATVKVNRTIYLTINRAQPPLVEMPNLVGFSLRNAQMYLENLGLHLGDTTFRPDIAKNSVLEQLYNNEPIKAGTKIFMGSTISFILGNGIGDLEIGVPDLMGKQYSQARSLLRSMDINFTPVFDADVTDSAHAYVTRQNPTKYGEASDGSRRYNRIKPGQTIDIWLSTQPLPVLTDSTKVAAESTPQ